MRFNSFFLLLYILVLYTVPCYGGSISEINDNNQTLQNNLIFIGVSEKLSNRDDSIQAALLDAARKFSFFNSVSGIAITRDIIGNRTLDFRIETGYQLLYDEKLDKFLEQLEYNPLTDVFEINNTIFVVTRVTSNILMPLSIGFSFERERPYWIDLPPAEINGFTVGVGFSSRFNFYSDTVIKSYEDAVLAIIENIEIHVMGESINYQNNQTTLNITRSKGTLKNFYIIESWTDPVSHSVWTLAVANRSE